MHSVTFALGAPGALRRIPALARFTTIAALAAVAGAVGCAPRSPSEAVAETLRIGARGIEEAPRVLRESLFAEPLISFDPQGRLVQRLATNWKWEQGGRILQLTLRPGVTFHDGTPLSGDVVAGILRQQVSTSGFEAVSRIDSPDDKSIVFYLTQPDAFLLGILAGTLIIDKNKPNVGTGPFKILTTEPALEAVRFPGYYRGAPAIHTVKVATFESQRAAWAAMMRGEVDMVQEVNRDAVEFLEGATRVSLYPSLRPFYIPLVFNLRHPVLKNVEVRRALAEAIDRDELVMHAMGGKGQVADDPVWPSHWAYSTAARRYTYNPGAARLRLEAAGLPVRKSMAGTEMASRFRIRCLFWNEDPQFERIALLLQRQFAEVGIDLVLQGATQGELAKRASAGEFETYLFQMTSGRSFDWTYRFWHSPPAGRPAEIQDAGYSGADGVLDELRLALSESDVRAAVGDLRQRFYEDAPAAFLAWTQITRAVDSRFDVGDRSDPDLFANLWRWRVVPPQRAER